MIVTFHQPPFLAGASVIGKVLSADAVVWMDTVQYAKGGWTNRQRLPDGSWLTVPVARDSSFAPINRVRIGEPQGEWRTRVSHAIWAAWTPCGAVAPEFPLWDVCREVQRGYPLLVGLNAAILTILLDAFDYQGEQHWQSHLDADHALAAVSDDRATLAPISERIAKMVAALGGSTYLSGPSGRNYLSEEPFAARGIGVDYYRHEGPNPCALELLTDRMEITRVAV